MSTARVRGLPRQPFGVIAFALAVSCVYDGGDRCGPRQRLDGYDRCVCEPGTVPTESGCEACAEGEVAVGDSCECAPGTARQSPDEPCAPVPAGLGAKCSAASDCLDPAFPHCWTSGAESGGYCTRVGCGSSAECSGGYACELDSGGSYCRRPPLGLGAACESAADCAGLEATYCESFQSHQCMVEGCSTASDDCFEGYECCDLTSLGLGKTLCVPEGRCPT